MLPGQKTLAEISLNELGQGRVASLAGDEGRLEGGGLVPGNVVQLLNGRDGQDVLVGQAGGVQARVKGRGFRHWGFTA